MIDVDIYVAWTADLHAVASSEEDAVNALLNSPDFIPGTLYRVAQFNASLPLPGVEAGGKLTVGRPHLQLVS